MQMYEYLVVTSDNKSLRIVADSIKGVLEAVDEEETPILNIFRNVPISEGGKSNPATVQATVEPDVAYKTGCRAYPNIPVDTAQGKAIVLSCSRSAGWKFDGWFCNDKFISSDLQASIINEEAGKVVYVAKFSPAV